MEMLQLRYFYDSARTESFSKTAQKYMVPVSSVSASIKRLEKELDTTLFTRMGNRVLLNEKGRQFLSVVSNTLTQLDMGVSALSADMPMEQTISILCLGTRKSIVRQILKFHKLYPSVFFDVQLEDVSENYGKYDIIICGPGEEFADYECFQWCRYAVRVEALETDPLCRESITLRHLKDRLFVISNSQGGAFEQFSRACKRKGFTPKVLLKCNDYACWDAAVQSGACLGLNFGNKTGTGSSNTQFLTISDFDAYFVGNVYYKQEVYNGTLKLFIDFLKKSVV